MKLSQVVDSRFKNTVSKLLDQDMPLKAVLVLKGIVDLLNSEIDKYEVTRQELLKKYGKKDAEGNLVVGENRHVQFEEDNLAAYSKEYSDLANKDIEVPTLTVQDLGDKVSLSHSDLLNLSGLIV